jgi:beta-lactamase superfamily II metal-dependent hydrolase
MLKVMNKKAWRVISNVFVILLFSSYLVAAGEDNSWKPGEFQIHIFKVGQGDSQLIISPSGKTLLIDIAELNWNSKKGTKRVVGKIKDVMGEDFNHIDYVVASHLHLDHIGYAGTGGIWALIEKYGFTIGKLVDRDSGEWVDRNDNGVVDDENEIAFKNAGTISGTALKWLVYVLDPRNASKLNREIAQIGSTSQIDLDDNIVVEVIESDACDVKMQDGSTPVSGDHTLEDLPPSENDYSITLKISFNQLDYVTGGDTDGEYAESTYGYVYDDVESVIASRIGAVEIVHVNHHGSAHSSNQNYLKALYPMISIISCGKNTYGHPDQLTLDRLLSISRVYLTEKGDHERDYKTSILVDGDIVIKSTDGKNFTVNGSPFTVKQN